MKDLMDLEEKKDVQEKVLLISEVRQLIYDKKQVEALQLIANYILKHNNIKTIRNDKIEEVYIYKEGIYLENGKSYIKEFSEEILGSQYTKHKVNNIIEKVIAKTYIDENEFFNQQLDNAYLTPVLNGVLDLKNNKLLPFSPKYYFFNKIKIEYKKDAKCDKIISFIKQITKSDNDVEIIQELFGFSLVKEYTYEKSFMFYGANGRNGKSKLLSILEQFLGHENVSSIDLQEFNKDNFASSNLRNKFINIGSDISNEALTDTSIFKKLTGRDIVHANRKNLGRVQFINYAKMVFAANELPPINTISDAFWQRWVIIEFPYQFLPKKELDVLPDDKKENVFLQDPSIIDFLTTDEEMQGLLIWSINGLSRLIENKDFSNKDTSKDIHVSWLRKSNSVAAFIYDEVEESFDGHITKQEFKKRYLNYCRNNNLKSLSDRVIHRTVGDESGATTKRKTCFVEGVGNDYIYVWEGINFKHKTIVIKEDVSQQSLVAKEEFVVDDSLASLRNDFSALLSSGSDFIRFDYFIDKGYVESLVQKFFDSKVLVGDLYESSPGVWRVLK